jgi:hypothetical protein
MSNREILELAKTIRYDLTALQAKLSELMRMAGEAPDRESHTCPECGLGFKGTRSLAEHRYVQHDGPEPEHWLDAEAKADLDPIDELAQRRTTR